MPTTCPSDPIPRCRPTHPVGVRSLGGQSWSGASGPAPSAHSATQQGGIARLPKGSGGWHRGTWSAALDSPTAALGYGGGRRKLDFSTKPSALSCPTLPPSLTPPRLPPVNDRRSRGSSSTLTLLLSLRADPLYSTPQAYHLAQHHHLVSAAHPCVSASTALVSTLRAPPLPSPLPIPTAPQPRPNDDGRVSRRVYRPTATRRPTARRVCHFHGHLGSIEVGKGAETVGVQAAVSRVPLGSSSGGKEPSARRREPDRMPSRDWKQGGEVGPRREMVSRFPQAC